MTNVHELTIQGPTSVVSMTPPDMLNRALASGASMEVLEKFMALSERWEANQARKAFDEAVANAKPEIPVIVRNATGHNSKRYADFAAIASAVDPVLGKHGLSYRFRTVQTDKIAVTCILSHKSGHSEETTLCGPADATGNKNAIQAIGSTLTYLQRYTLVQALGLAASNDDDGAKADESGLVSEQQLNSLVDLCDAVEADKAKFCTFLKVPSLAAIKAKDYQRAIDALNAKRAK